MPIEIIVLIIMLAVFGVSVLVFKIPSGVSFAVSSVAGALIAGEGIPLRHLIEGTFGYLDAMLIIASAMIFMKTIEATGTLGTISNGMIRGFYKNPTLLMIVMMFFVMFPGMLTGLSSACILTTGALVAPAMIAMGIPAVGVGSFIAMAAVFGMIAPPINIPVMIIGGGVDMPYIGFDIPLLIATVPLALFTAVYFRIKYVRTIQIEKVLEKLPPSLYAAHGIKLFIPIVVVVGLMIGIRVVPEAIPDIGVPLIFMLGVLTSFGTGEKFNIWKISRTAVREALPVMAILIGVGMFVQIMTLTGVRGYLAVAALKFPPEFLYPGLALLMPAFGSAYAASSVVGVPMVFVFLGRNEIVVTSALSLIAGIGDLMPPPSLLCVVAAQLTGVKNHFSILKESWLIIFVSLCAGIVMLIFGREIGSFIFG